VANQRQNVSTYRYFLYDLLSNTFLAEVPFKGVSYGRSIKEAGPFSGSIPIIDPTANLDLYNSTMPGKTALYVVRDDKCVWGGIIWSRSYNIITRSLSVNASEFTSYLHHRTVWQTWSSTFDGSVSIVDGIGTMTLDTGTYDFNAGMPVDISFGNENNYKYAGYYTILSSPAPSTTSFSFTAEWFDGDTSTTVSIPNLLDNTSSVNTRADTYHYMREMLQELSVDFSDLEFANDAIEPGVSYRFSAINYQRSYNPATGRIEATIQVDSPHWAVIGQKIKISNIGNGLDGSFTILDIPTDDKFVYESTGSDIPLTAISGNKVTIIKKAVTAAGLVTLTTSAPHGFNYNDVVVINNVDVYLDGVYLIDDTTTNTITYTGLASAVEETLSSGVAQVDPLVVFGSYGSFKNNGDIGLGFSTNEISGFNNKNTIIRGFELKFAGEILDAYSNTINGFEYRIDCTYDKLTNSFSKTLVFMPFKPKSLSDYLDTLPGGKLAIGEAAPPSAFGADKVIFEHPGNVIDATMEESAEDAATRMWFSGNDSSLGSDASQPYSAAYADGYLGGLEFPWPVLDQVERSPYPDLGEEALQQYAEQFLADSLPPISTFNISVNGSISPEVGDYSPGDWCTIRFNDAFVQNRLDSGLESRTDILVRKIDSYTVSVPDTPTFPEKVDLQLITEAQVDKIGNSKTS
jgi:hypothetical protein